MILYENTIKNVRDALINKRLIPLMLDSCEESFGTISPLLKLRIKLAMSELDYLLFNKKINEPNVFDDGKTKTIGDLPHITGLYPSGAIANNYCWKEFKDFAKKSY